VKKQVENLPELAKGMKEQHILEEGDRVCQDASL
jgi:hypothetical protein